MNTENAQELIGTGVLDYIQQIKVKAVRWNGHNLGDIVSLRNESILAAETDSNSWAKTCTSSMNVGDWLVLDELKTCFLIKTNEEFRRNFKETE